MKKEIKTDIYNKPSNNVCGVYTRTESESGRRKLKLIKDDIDESFNTGFVEISDTSEETSSDESSTDTSNHVRPPDPLSEITRKRKLIQDKSSKGVKKVIVTTKNSSTHTSSASGRKVIRKKI